MEIILWMILGVCGVFAIHFGLTEVDKRLSFKWGLLLVFGVIATVLSMTLTGMAICKKQPQPVKGSKFDVKTEITVTTKNGVETLRDTIYIFTPKK